LASQKPELSLFKSVTLADEEIPIIDHFKDVREFWSNNSINQTADLIVDLNFDDLFYSTNIPPHIKTKITALNDILVQRIQQDPEYQKLYNSILKSSLKPITSRTGFVGMPTFYPIIPTQVQELLDRINARVRQIRSEAARELLTPRKATAADREYRQAYVDKALRENFGIDTTTDLYTADPASLAKIDRSNLEERVRTKEETAFINALKKLQAGKQAQQLSTENIGQTVSDIIQKSNIKQKIQEDTQKAFQEFLQKLSQHGPIEGHGKAGQHIGFGQWVNHHESVKIDPLQVFLQQHPEIIQRMGNTGNRTSGLYDAAAAGLQMSNPAFALIPNLANTISDIGSALFGSSAEGARNEAHRYALADAMAKTRELWQRLGHGRRIKFK
ncbi:MAG: hypothetical protein RML94_01750, partial [Bacteroidia bacterium]|nr:hypothetical protein [Bacteroidia bacterium]